MNFAARETRTPSPRHSLEIVPMVMTLLHAHATALALRLPGDFATACTPTTDSTNSCPTDGNRSLPCFSESGRKCHDLSVRRDVDPSLGRDRRVVAAHVRDRDARAGEVYCGA